MRCVSGRAKTAGLLLLVLLAGVSGALAQPSTPTVYYPADGATNIKWNPTIFWSAYSRSGAGFAKEIQLDFQIQIASASTFDATSIVYETDNGGTGSGACMAASPPKCYGAGMAHYVSAEDYYPGLFKNALAGGTDLAQDTQYWLQMRVMGEDGTWSAWTPTVSFRTVQYNGDTFHVDPAGVDGTGCGGVASPCANLGYVINQRVQDDHGDIIILNPGTYALPQAGSSSDADIDFSGSQDFPNRLWIRGASETSRPILEADQNPPDGSSQDWIKTDNMEDVIWENLVFQGHPDCCTSTCRTPSTPSPPAPGLTCYRSPGDAPDSQYDDYVWRSSGLGRLTNSKRNSFVNVKFTRNVRVEFHNKSLAGQDGDADLLFKNVDFQGTPEYSFEYYQSDDNAKFEPIRLYTPKFLTLKNVYFDSTANTLNIESASAGSQDVGDASWSNFTHGVLVEETRWDRNSEHPFRPFNKNMDYTLRRVTFSGGPEAFSTTQGFGGGQKAHFENIVVENSTFFSYGSNFKEASGTTDVKYFVLVNNIYTNSHSSPDGKGWALAFSRDDEGGRGFIAPSTRVFMDYLGYHKAVEHAGREGLVTWFPVEPDAACAGVDPDHCFTYRGEPSQSVPWNDWLAIDGGAYDQNSPFQLYDTDKKEPPDPLFVQEPNINNLPSLGGVGPLGDFNLQAGSPLIDAGHPSYRVPAGGGSRVDIGAYESTGGGPVDRPPIANAGPNQSVDELSLVALDGSASSDPEGAPLTYQWTQVSGPSQSLDDPTAEGPTFVATDVSGSSTLRFSLVVNDGAQPSSPDTVDISVRDLDAPGVDCTDTAIRAAIAAANGAGGGTITLNCSDTTIPFNDVALGEFQDNVILDGESKSNTLEFTTNFAGCSPGDNGIGGQAIARVLGDNNVIRGFTFKNFLESLQVSGSNNLIEDNTFVPHACSDDALSQISTSARNNTYQFNLIEGYSDKAFMMSSGGGTIHGNVFTDNNSPLRANLDNSGGDTFIVSDNIFNTTGDRTRCNGPYFEGDYVIEFTGNRVECLRGFRIGGSVEILIDQNIIEGNDRVGVRLFDTAVASLSRNVIQDNGFSGGSLPSGGVSITDSATADLGGGSLSIGGVSVSSPGSNIIRGNQNDGVALGGDVVNSRAGYTVSALQNCWDGTTASEIQNDVSGDVVFQPFSLDCSGAANSGPVVTPVFPVAGELCTLLGNPITILVEDTMDAVDVLSLSVLINGAVVTPSISGSGSSIMLSMPFPDPLPGDGHLTVEVSVADLAVPANVSFLSYGFFVQGTAPSGVSVN